MHYFPAPSCDHVTPYVTLCDISSHAINRIENKGKEIEKKIHIDLAVIASQWSELAVHDKSGGVKRTQ